MAFELKILTDLSKMPKVVETNIDDIEPIIASAIERVDGLVVTENKDDILAADADAAKLRKMSDAIKRFRIDHISIWKSPMEAFESKCKNAEKRLTDAATTLTAKTCEVKDIWRNKKREQCAELWASKLVEAFVDDEQVQTCDGVQAFFNHWTDGKTKGTWLNSSVTLTSVGDAMDAEIVRIKQVLDSAKAVYANEPPEVAAKARIALLKNMSLTDAIQAVTDWKAEQKAIAEATASQKSTETAKTDEKNLPDSEPIETYNLAVTGTRKALVEMKRYAMTLGITFKNLNK